MKKKHFFWAIIFFIVSFVYGAVFNFILQGEDATIGVAIMQGMFVGILSAGFYYILVLFSVACIEEGFFKDIIMKFLLIWWYICIATILWCGLTTFISGKAGISPSYAWMHIVNLVFTLIVIVKATYDGKVLEIPKKDVFNN